MFTAPLADKADDSAFTGSNNLSLVGLPGGNRNDSADLTIHRITPTHHGRTLLMLGHAAEYLAESRRFLTQPAGNSSSDDEAIHILLGLSRQVFDEYAMESARARRIDRFVIDCFSRLFN